MAVSGLVCRSRLLCRIEIKNVLCNPVIINRTLLNESKRKWRECRKLSTSLSLAEKKNNKDALSLANEAVSRARVATGKAEAIRGEGVTVTYFRGLPVVTVPLPSRRERCRFTLRPIANTVGDFLTMLKREDRGIDRAAVLSQDGTRIAASNTLESLLEDDFTLSINDIHYKVKTPIQERLSEDELERLGDVRNLVNQLYEALNVREHQQMKEREIALQLEQLRIELQPLEERREQLEVVAQRRGNALAWIGLGLMSVQFGVLARLTWWEYSWDIMEPVTYFVTYGTAMACYAYFVLTKQEYILPDVKDRQHLFTIHKRARKEGLDLGKYNSLKEQINLLERDLARLRDPLQLHLPLQPADVTDISNKDKPQAKVC